MGWDILWVLVSPLLKRLFIGPPPSFLGHITLYVTYREAPLKLLTKAFGHYPNSPPPPELCLAQIRKVEARLGKLAKIRKVETD